jgi:membrane fusion protein, multidrug efflux system
MTCRLALRKCSSKRLPLEMLVLAAALFACAGCGKKDGAPGGAGGPPPATVIAADVSRKSLAETLAVVGTLAANEMVEIKSEVDGNVAEIVFKEGQAVKKGDLLVRLDDTKFKAALAEAEANLNLTRLTYERTRQLVADKTISPQEHDQAAAAFHANEAAVVMRKRDLQDARIVAPFDGTVGARNLSPGQVISKNTTIAWLVDVNTLKAEFSVPERFIGEVKGGQKIEIVAAAFPKERFKGEVYFLAPHVDAPTRTLLIKAAVPNGHRKLLPGMFVTLDLTLRLSNEATVIPESALLSMGDRTVVYVIGNDRVAQIRPVKVGLRMPDVVEITSGLQVGEKVVAEGLQKVRPGAPVIIATNPPSARAEARPQHP